jgi:hypothetical protein
MVALPPSNDLGSVMTISADEPPSPDSDMGDRIAVSLTRGDLYALIAALHVYLADIRDRRADEPEVVARADTGLGRLIWRLEVAAASPHTVGGHSADAVSPE